LVEEKNITNHLYAVIAGQTEAQAQAVKLKTYVVVGHPVSAIVDFIKREHCDLLVVGYMGHSALYNRVIGGTTDRLVDHVPCAILVVK
jgi:nucleotide-binding universal stress UspA family protein